jgi:hypothetical protein
MKKNDVMVIWKLYETITYTKMRSPPIYGSYPCYWKTTPPQCRSSEPKPKPLPIRKKETR